jgi:hypothetical protein
VAPAIAGVLPIASASSAPDVSGQKYSDASATLTNAGLEAVVSTTVGDRKAWPDCLVTFSQQRDVKPPPNSKAALKHRVLVALNCNAAVASPKAPGYSAASSEGKAIAAAANGS